MENDWKTRTTLLIGEQRQQRLSNSHVLIVGVGGVGAYAAELICRAGVGSITLVDADCVNSSNINRQIPALHSTIGQPKVKVMEQRLLDINPQLEVITKELFLRDEQIEIVLKEYPYDFVVDAIDSISPKTYLLYHAYQLKIPIVSSMGAGAKEDVSQIKIADISKSECCALAKVIRHRLKKMGIKKGIPVVFSTEMANKGAVEETTEETCKRTITGTISYMPATFGCFLASYVLRNLERKEDDND